MTILEKERIISYWGTMNRELYIKFEATSMELYINQEKENATLSLSEGVNK